MVLKEVKTGRFYYYEKNNLVTALGNIYKENVTLEWLLKNGFKKSRKKNIEPKVYGRIYGICYKV